MAAPPVVAGAVQLTVAVVLPAVAVPMVGAPGAVGVAGAATGVTAPDRAEKVPVPALLVAATSKVYAVPLVRPVMEVLVTAPTGVVFTSVVPEKVRTE